MSDLQYEFYRNSSGSYLVFRVKQLSDDYIRKMLAAQNVPFLLRESIVCLGSECELHYRISGMRSVERRYTKQKMRTAEIVMLLDQIVRLRDACAAYLLPDTHLFLTPDLIYMPHMENECRFLYLPEEETSFEVQMRTLADFLMKHISYERSEDAGVELVYTLRDAASREGFDLKLWMSAHRPKTESAAAADSASGAENTWFMQAAEQIGTDTFEVVSLTDDWDMKWNDDFYGEDEQKGAAAAAAQFLVKDVGSGKKHREKKGRTDKTAREDKSKKHRRLKKEKADSREKKENRFFKHSAASESGPETKKRRWFRDGREQDQRDADDAADYTFPYEEICAANQGGVQEYYGGQVNEDETVCLSEMPSYSSEQNTAQTLHVLIPMNGGSQIRLDGDFFLIGVSARHTDITLSDPTVSRVHAEIFSDETGIWIEDCNSRNGTLVDGQMLGANEPKRLETGMHIRMGRSEFVFR